METGLPTSTGRSARRSRWRPSAPGGRHGKSTRPAWASRYVRPERIGSFWSSTGWCSKTSQRRRHSIRALSEPRERRAREVHASVTCVGFNNDPHITHLSESDALGFTLACNTSLELEYEALGGGVMGAKPLRAQNDAIVERRRFVTMRIVERRPSCRSSSRQRLQCDRASPNGPE